MVIEHDIGAMPPVPDIGMQAGGDDALHAGLAVKYLGIRANCTTVAAQMALPICTFYSSISIADIGL